jgi:hypothetical protein
MSRLGIRSVENSLQPNPIIRVATHPTNEPAKIAPPTSLCAQLPTYNHAVPLAESTVDVSQYATEDQSRHL